MIFSIRDLAFEIGSLYLEGWLALASAADPVIDKNKGLTLCNFTKHGNLRGKSCCSFRIESERKKRYTLSIESKGAW